MPPDSSPQPAASPLSSQSVASASLPALSYNFSRENGVLVRQQPAEKSTGSAGGDNRMEICCREEVPLSAVLEVLRVAPPGFGDTGLSIRRISASEFDAALTAKAQTASTETNDAMQQLGEQDDLASLAADLQQPEDLLAAQDDAPIIKLINALLTQAVRDNASDIHIEPFEQRLSVRFRIDGVMRDVLEPPLALAPVLVSRIKVMAQLDIAEKRLPQDGRIAIRIGDRPIDLRVSTLPSGYGERVVLRLLDKQQGRLDLEGLGMAADQLALIDEIIRRPHGIVLVTGPTGSGKTTTLYAALGRINDASRNILTVEDPIEYFIDGIGQTQINTKVDMSFARGLRAILRQDPDVVMVGEMRDTETARIGVQASLTGHMVFSTLHTNTAAGAITRLRDMGIEPFLLASSLSAVLAQRLVRRLCPVCKLPREATAEERKRLGLDGDKPVILQEAVGCEACSQTGYQGRTGIYELLIVDDALRALIHDDASEALIRDQLQEQSRSLFGDGVQKVLAGETAIEELIRVTTA